MKLNRHLYDKDILFSAAYVLLDQAYFHFDIDGEYYVINIKPKNPQDNIEDRFLNLLLSHKSHKLMTRRNVDIKKSILKRIIISNS